MSNSQSTYQFGQTLLVVPTGNTGIAVVPPKNCIGYYFGYQSGGTLAVTNSLSAAFSTGSILGTTERIYVDGPATFFMISSGATSIASILFKYSAGFSMFP